jgi:hypothetical protein
MVVRKTLCYSTVKCDANGILSAEFSLKPAAQILKIFFQNVDRALDYCTNAPLYSAPVDDVEGRRFSPGNGWRPALSGLPTRRM